jgi:DNA polymerase-3 subunit epsilon
LLEATVAKLTARPSLPANLDASAIDALPDGPGVYLFYGENDLPLYVGKSTGIRKRVLAHFAADHATAKEMALAQQVRRIDCIATGGEVGALLKEAALIKTLQPIHNRSLRRNDELCFWQLVEARQGEWRPQLVPVQRALPAQLEKLYGPFKTAREAKRVLQELARAASPLPRPARPGKAQAGQALLSPIRSINARAPASARNPCPFTARA